MRRRTGASAARQKHSAASDEETIERYEIVSGWIPRRTQNCTAPCAVARKIPAIGRRHSGRYSNESRSRVIAGLNVAIQASRFFRNIRGGPRRGREGGLRKCEAGYGRLIP